MGFYCGDFGTFENGSSTVLKIRQDTVPYKLDISVVYVIIKIIKIENAPPVIIIYHTLQSVGWRNNIFQFYGFKLELNL